MRNLPEPPLLLTPGGPAAEHAPRALIASHSPLLRPLLRATLAETHRCSEALDVQQALAEIERALPDVILLDLCLPGGDTFDLCRRCTEAAGGRGLVIMLAPLADSQVEQLALQVGAAAYLSTPFSPLQLLDAVWRITGARTPEPRSERLGA